MALPFRAALAAAAILSLGGCQTAFDAVGVAVPLTASESHQFDGSYQGRVTQLSATGPGCPTEQAERVVMVGDGVLWYAYSPVTLFAAPIHYDGSIDDMSGNTHLTGQVKGDQLDATVESPNCRTRLSMHYILNRS